MAYFSYLLLRFFFFIFRLLPFRVIYFLSDGLAFLLNKVLKYRKKVARENLQKSFPEKSSEEIQTILTASYKNLADILLESFKGMSISEKDLEKRFVLRNPELINDYNEKGQSLIGVAPHFNNWEWGPMAFAYQLEMFSLGFYKPIKNKYLNAYIERSRSFDNVGVRPIHQTSISFEKPIANRPTFYVFIMDQSPSNADKSDWMEFLNQPTAVLHGADRYARKYKFPVIYIHIFRKGRGRYEVEFELLTEDAAATPIGTISKRFMKELEKEIIENPAYWLWTHKRWKLKASEGIELY